MEEVIEIQCPSCGSNDVETVSELENITVPFAPVFHYTSKLHNCRNCGMSADFSITNEKDLQFALKKAKNFSVLAMIHALNKSRSMSYFERAFELPIRTTMRWKEGKYSASALALLRIVSLYPWLTEVADAQFDQDYAKKCLAQEGLKAISEIAQALNVDEEMSHNKNKLTITWVRQPDSGKIASVTAREVVKESKTSETTVALH